MSKKTRSFLISFVFTAVILYVLLSNISIKSLLEIIKGIPLTSLVLVFVIHLSAYIFRSLVFYLFFGRKSSLSFLYLLIVHFIHNFYVHVVPASLGEVSFPILLRRQVKPENSIPVLFVARIIFFLLTLLLFIVAAFLNFNLFDSIKTDFSQYLLVLLIIIPVALIIIFRKQILKLLNRSKYFRKIKVRIKETIQNTRTEWQKLSRPGFLVVVLLLTIGNIIALTLTYMLILRAMDLHLSFFQIIFVSSIGIAFVILPIKSIGGFGTTEGAWAIGMLLLGFGKEIAIESGFTVHLIALMNVVIMFVAGIILKNTIYRKKS